jgi:GrpB-like predicted nucleotidyltransferase (UPF0157 family)
MIAGSDPTAEAEEQSLGAEKPPLGADKPPLGPKRLAVQLVEHQREWMRLTDDACEDIRSASGSLLLDVQHVGSTAVADLAAKPILDIAAAVADSDVIPQLVDQLARVGYIYRGDAGTSGGHFFVRESAPDVRTIHFHVVGSSDQQWSNYIRFREILRQDPEVRDQYARLKADLEAKYADDRPSYTASKHDFIRSVLGMERTPYKAPDWRP